MMSRGLRAVFLLRAREVIHMPKTIKITVSILKVISISIVVEPP